jgi:omega-6 fatty acid desaturase (delta-12 desaturase)
MAGWFVTRVGPLDKRGAGEIYTMTLAEYERASRARRVGYRAYRNPC